MEAASGIDLADRFRIAGLDRIVKQHTRYARQNGIHVSPSFMVDGLVNDRMSSGDSVDDWARMIGV
jgi:protein-disulfide isomerase